MRLTKQTLVRVRESAYSSGSSLPELSSLFKTQPIASRNSLGEELNTFTR